VPEKCSLGFIYYIENEEEKVNEENLPIK